MKEKKQKEVQKFKASVDSTGDDALAQIIYKYTGRRDQVVEEDSSVEDSSVYELSMKKP